jgi:hypothetical protein
MWAVAILMTAIPAAYILAGSTDDVLTSEEGTLASYGFMLAWGLCFLGAVTMLFVFYVNWIPTAIPNDIFPALNSSYGALSYVFLGWTALGLVWYLIIKFTRSEVVRAVGTRGRRGRPERRRRGGRRPPHLAQGGRAARLARGAV